MCNSLFRDLGLTGMQESETFARQITLTTCFSQYIQQILPPQVAYRGVERNPQPQSGHPRFTAVIYLGKEGGRDRKHRVSTTFCTAEEAAQGHDRAAIAVFGPDLAITNFPLESYGTEVRSSGEILFSLGDICTEFLKGVYGG